MQMLLVKSEESKGEEICQGLRFRGRVETFRYADGTIVYKQSLRPLKTLSCPGCSKCFGLHDILQEEIDEGVTFGENIQDGKLYEYFISTYYDYSTGREELSSTGFKQIKEVIQ